MTKTFNATAVCFLLFLKKGYQMASIKVKCKSLSFRERTLDFKRIRPGNIISVDKDRAQILFDGGWVDYVNPKDIPKKEKPKEKKAVDPERETKELKEVKDEQTK